MQTTPKTSQPKRRWFQYSLRAFLLFVLAVGAGAGWLGWHVRRCQREARAIERVSSGEDGRSANVLYSSPFQPYRDEEQTDFTFARGPAWLTKLLGGDIFRAATFVQCVGPGNTFEFTGNDDGQLVIRRTYKSGPTDDDMLLIAELPYLRALHLEANGITDKGVVHLEPLKRLETLNLSHTAISDAAAPSLAKFLDLRDLDLSRTHVSDASIEWLAKCQALRTLNLEMTRVTPDGANSLRALLPECEIKH